jgi:UDP-glucose 4-epimerase
MILIIGYGFLGKALYESLKYYNYEVKVISKSIDCTNNKDFIKSDLLNINSLTIDFTNLTTVIHCAHTTVPVTSMLDNVFDVETNVIPLINLMTFCKRKMVENFIYISSGGAVYGNVEDNLKVKETQSTNPISSYGITKLTMEKYIQINRHYFKGNCIILRPSNIFGISQNIAKPQGIIGYIRYAIETGSKLEIWGDGENLKDYLHIDDFISAIKKVIDYKFQSRELVYNISSGNIYSLNYFLSKFEEKYKVKINRLYKEALIFDVKSVILSSDLFSLTFNWKSKITFEDFINQIE